MKSKKAMIVRKQVTAALFAALLSVLSIISIPTPSSVPLTFQTFAVALCGFVLGWKYGTVSVLLYIVAGTVGFPVFAGMTGGVGKLVGVTGGFIFGFIPFVMLCGACVSRGKLVRLLLGLAGLAVCHIFGIVFFALIAGSGLIQAALTVSVPYLIKDALSVIAAFFASLPLGKFMKLVLK